MGEHDMLNRRDFVRGVAGVGAMTVVSSGSAAAGEPMMSLNVVYPTHDGYKFDIAYYRATHIPMAMKIMKADRVILIEGVPNAGAAAPPYAMIAHFQFASAEALKTGTSSPQMPELRADIPKFTDIKPTIMLGKTV
jgi:uncharacterized protein (TIGR02118 family)